MNINNFETQIDKTILDRGYTYYKDGYIKEIFLKDKNNYFFVIEGSYNYNICVKIDNDGKIIDTKCDCPYDFGPICKHQVAAYFKLHELLNSGNLEEVKINNNVATDINKILHKLSKDELINIIIDLTIKDETLEDSIIAKYTVGNKKQELEKCKNLIDSIKRKYLYGDGYISYREVGYFTRDMYDLVKIIKTTDDKQIALNISMFVLKEFIDSFQYADDSGGDIGMLVEETIEEMREIIISSNKTNFAIKENMFNLLLEYIESNVFDGWSNFKIDVLYICYEFCDDEALREKLIKKIKSMLTDNYDKYDNEMMLKLIFDIIDEYSTKMEAEEFIKNNINFTTFRELLINNYIEKKRYDEAVEIALEGEKKDIDYAGLVTKWKNYRYIAYKESYNKAEQEKLAKELLFNGDFKYYNELKQIIKTDKKVFYNNLKNEILDIGNVYSKNIYLELIEEENDVDEIMAFVRKNTYYIDAYVDKLKDKFFDEALIIYENYIFDRAKSTSTRKQYREVCKVIKKFKKISGKSDGIIHKLKTAYHRRPAFIDELNKI
jgi:hypothetical protein